MIPGMRAATEGGKAMWGNKWRNETEANISGLILPTILRLILQKIAPVILPKSLRTMLPKRSCADSAKNPRADTAKKALGCYESTSR